MEISRSVPPVPTTTSTTRLGEADVAYNPTDNQYLVGWQGDDLDKKDEIFVRLVNANGTFAGAQVKVSNHVPGDDDYDAHNAAIVHNPAENQFLVVWQSDDNTGALVNNEIEVYGQLLSPSAAAGWRNLPHQFPGSRRRRRHRCRFS